MNSISIGKAAHEISHDKIVDLLFMVMPGRIYTVFIQDDISNFDGFIGYAGKDFFSDTGNRIGPAFWISSSVTYLPRCRGCSMLCCSGFFFLLFFIPACWDQNPVYWNMTDKDRA